MSSNTSRLSLPYPATTDNVSAFPAVNTTQMDTLDAAVTVTEGTLASRPSASTVPYGCQYYATDTAQLFMSTGASWLQIVLASNAVVASGQTQQVTIKPISGTSASLTPGWQTVAYTFTAFPTTCLGAVGVIGPITNGSDASAWNYAGFSNGTIDFNVNPSSADTFRVSGVAWGY